MNLRSEPDPFGLHVVAPLLAVLLALRLAVAAAMPLAFDEAYYWTWSESLAGGFYDHPPMVALVIWLGTLVAGDTEFGVRIISVLLGIPATWAVWRAAAILFADGRIAAAAALYLNLTLAMAAGTLVVTPDAPLIVASAFVLFFLAKVHETGQGVWWLAVGAAMGCALLSKYSALFLGAGIAIWLLWIPAMRRWLATPWPYLGAVIAVVLFSPVIAWNAEHQWVSFIKQFGRARVDGLTLRFLGEHVGAQIGFATPFVCVLGVMGLWAFFRGRTAARPGAVLIGALVWPLTLYFLWHALHARVEGNWTAPIFPAFAVAAAVAAYGVAWTGPAAATAAWSRRLAAPVALAMTVVIYAQAVFGIVPLGAIDPTARQLGVGWRAAAVEIDALRRENGARAVVVPGYALRSWLSFYLPSRPPVIQFGERIRWINMPEPNPDLFAGPVLYICEVECAKEIRELRARFETVREIARIPRRRRGVEIEVYGVYLMERPRGDPLDHSLPVELQKSVR